MHCTKLERIKTNSRQSGNPPCADPPALTWSGLIRSQRHTAYKKA